MKKLVIAICVCRKNSLLFLKLMELIRILMIIVKCSLFVIVLERMGVFLLPEMVVESYNVLLSDVSVISVPSVAVDSVPVPKEAVLVVEYIVFWVDSGSVDPLVSLLVVPLKVVKIVECVVSAMLVSPVSIVFVVSVTSVDGVVLSDKV